MENSEGITPTPAKKSRTKGTSLYKQDDRKLLQEVRDNVFKQTAPIEPATDTLKPKKRSRAKDVTSTVNTIVVRNSDIMKNANDQEQQQINTILTSLVKERKKSQIGIVGNMISKGIITAEAVDPKTGKILLEKTTLDPEEFGFLRDYTLSDRSKLRQESASLLRDRFGNVIRVSRSEDSDLPPTVQEKLQDALIDNLQAIADREHTTDTIPTPSTVKDTPDKTPIDITKRISRVPKKVRVALSVAASTILGLFAANSAKAPPTVSAEGTDYSARSAPTIVLNETPVTSAASVLVDTKNAPISPDKPVIKPVIVSGLIQGAQATEVEVAIPIPSAPTPPPEIPVATEGANIARSPKPVAPLEIAQTPEVKPKPKPNVLLITGGKVFPFNQGFGHTEYAKTGVYALGIHTGWDLGVPSGTELFAPISGEIVQASMNYGSYGGAVIIRAEDGTYYLFGHMKKVNLKAGDKVDTGTMMGLSGGDSNDIGHGKSTGAHLHFETYTLDEHGKIQYQNPDKYYDRTGVPINKKEAGHDFDE